MPGILHYARLLTVGPKNPIPKKKRQLIENADREITRLEKTKTARTKAIESATGVASDVEKKKKAVARRARQSLLAMRGKK